MKLSWQPAPAVLVLCIAAILVLNGREFSSSPLLLFFVFNSIVVTIIVGSHKSLVHETGRIMPFSCSLYEVGSAYNPINKEIYTEEEEEEEHADACASDGHYEDDKGNGSDDDGDDAWDDDGDDYDENLERKIEDFIAKVTERWREERLMEEVRRLEKWKMKHSSPIPYTNSPPK